MNTDRRKRLSKAWSLLECLRDEEQESYDNLPEGLVATEVADRMLENIDGIDTAMDEIDQIVQS